MPQIDFTLVFAILKWFTYGVIAMYILIAVGLSMLAARLGMRGGWMAWVPILNLFLLCRMARCSFIWVIPAMIPIVGLAVLAYLGARVAQRLGMPAGVGVLFGVPFLGALVPIPMALGRGPLPEGSSSGAPSRSPIVAGIVSLAAMTCLVTMGVSGFWMTGRMTRKAPPTAKAVAASLPKTTASTLTEFPLDPSTVNPVRPTRVITQSFERPVRGKILRPVEVKVQSNQLPPWMPPASLPGAAESVAAADYVSSEGADTSVSVVTMVTWEEQSTLLAPPSAALLAKAGAGARATGIEVKNTEGEIYRGYKVSGGDSTYYAVNKTGTNINVIISASETGGAATADRLAGNLGIGDGVLHDGDYAGIFGELPSAPGNAPWRDVYTVTESDIEKYVQMVEHETATMSAEQAGEMAAFMPLIKQIRSLAPKRAGLGFNENGTTGYGAAIASFSNSRSAWLAFSAAELARTLVPMPAEFVIRPATVGTASGYFISVSDGGHGFVLRHGATIVGLGASPDMSEDELRRWAEAYLAKLN